MNHIKTLLVVILIAAAAIFGFRMLATEDSWVCDKGGWVRHGNPNTPMPTTPCKAVITDVSPSTTPTVQTVNLTEYKNSKMGFSVKLPLDIKTAENSDNTVSFSKQGPTQKAGTELFDGLSLNIDQGSLGSNSSLKSLIEADITQKNEQLSPDYKVLRPVAPINGGYYYQAQEIFGNVDYYYLTQTAQKFLIITVIQKDPGNLGFGKTVTDIIQSIVMTN